jgi:hemoglobin-like flavoprotein
MSSFDKDYAMYAANDHVKLPSPSRTDNYLNVQDKAEDFDIKLTVGHNSGTFVSTWNQNMAKDIPINMLIEHYQPYEFPICPVLNSDTQRLVKDSWQKIVETSYDSKDTQSGKMSGASYFYNHFFEQLFIRLADFARIFPDIKSRADIFSKVMAFCISIRVEELDLVKMKLWHLGQMHKSIIHHPYLFGIYATNIHSTIRYCLGESATHEVMSAWLHLLAFILRGMLPSYFSSHNFTGHHIGAVNAASAINDKVHEEVRSAAEMKNLKKKLASLQGTEPQSRIERMEKEVSISMKTPSRTLKSRLGDGRDSPLPLERDTPLPGQIALRANGDEEDIE